MHMRCTFDPLDGGEEGQQAPGVGLVQLSKPHWYFKASLAFGTGSLGFILCSGTFTESHRTAGHLALAQR